MYGLAVGRSTNVNWIGTMGPGIWMHENIAIAGGILLVAVNTPVRETKNGLLLD